MTVYANVVDNNVKGVYYNIPKFWKGINKFDILCMNDETFMRDNGFFKIIHDTTSYDSTTHKMSDFPTYSFVDGKVYEHREITPIPPYVSPTRDELLEPIRIQRDKLMKEFEWRYTRYARQLRLGLSPTENIESMDNYMQALADITNQEDLENLVWPTYQGE